MSDNNNNNLNERGFACCWPTCSENSYGSGSTDADSLSNEDLMLESGTSSESNRNINSPISPVMLETFNQNPSSMDGEAQSPHALLNGRSNWRLGSSPASSVMDDTMEWLDGDDEESDMGSLSELDYMYDNAPPLNGIRFYNPNYQQPANTDDTVEPTDNQANQSLDLRPIPGSIDLTNQPTFGWRAYQARLRARQLSFPVNQGRSTAGIEMPVGQRLCAGRPRNRHPTPMVYDPEFDSYVYYNNESDSEEAEEEPLHLPVMVPRRGNSVSDLSQCSSDYEPENKSH